MSVQSEIDRLVSAKAAIKTAIEGKNVEVPSDTALDGMAALIKTIATGGGGDLPNQISELRAAYIVPTSNITSNYTVRFSEALSKVPDFGLLVRIDTEADAISYASILQAFGSGMINNGKSIYIFQRYYLNTTSSTWYVSGGSASVGTNVTSTYWYIHLDSSAYGFLAAGYTYLMLVGVLA